MPKLIKRRKVRPTKRKYKVTKKRVKKLRRTKRKRLWYKKFKGKHSIYNFTKTQGLKFSLWLNLQDFLTLPWDSFLQPVLAAASNYDAQHPVTFKGNYMTDSFCDQSANLLGEILSVYSTEDFGQQVRSKFSKQKMFWKAFNPCLSGHTCGPMFNNMINQFNQVKFCGVKVAWYPNVKYVPSRNPDKFNQTNPGGTTQASVYNKMTIQEGNSTDPLKLKIEGDLQYHLEPPKGIHTLSAYLPWKNQMYGGYGNPPALRLWVNFNKQGYEQRDILTEKFVAGEIAGINEGKLIKGSRYCTARVFDDYNHLTYQQNIKSYPLNKPFKFYVRPMLVNEMNEAPTNNAVIRDYEGVSSTYQLSLLKANADSDSLVTGLKKFPYVQVNNLYPIYQDFMSGPSSTDAKVVNDWVVTNCVGKYFVDPILFSWCLSDDSAFGGDVSMPFSIEKNPGKYVSGTLNTAEILSYAYIQGLGKFKVTFYTKWRGRNVFQYIVSPKNSTLNANVQQELPNMEEEPI